MYVSLAQSFEQIPTRVITLAPNITELVFSVGAGDKIIGTVDTSDFPELAKNIARIGNFNQINLEQIFKLKPDLIIAWQQGTQYKTINQLRQLGFEVLILDTSSFAGIVSSLTTLGNIFNSEIASKKIKQFNKTLAKLKPKVANKASVFIQIWHKPLITLNNKNIFSEAIKFCGGNNIFGHLTQAAPTVNLENILKLNPDIIFISGGKRNIWQQWQGINAVKNKRIYAVNPDFINRGTMRTLKAVNNICNNINLN